MSVERGGGGGRIGGFIVVVFINVSVLTPVGRQLFYYFFFGGGVGIVATLDLEATGGGGVVALREGVGFLAMQESECMVVMYVSVYVRSIYVWVRWWVRD